jgi:hypothetical protein
VPPEAVPALAQSTRCFVTCVARLGREKEVLRFVRFVEKAANLWEDGRFVPLLAGASSDVDYANQVKDQLRQASWFLWFESNLRHSVDALHPFAPKATAGGYSNPW